MIPLSSRRTSGSRRLSLPSYTEFAACSARCSSMGPLVPSVADQRLIQERRASVDGCIVRSASGLSAELLRRAIRMGIALLEEGGTRLNIRGAEGHAVERG